MFISSCSGEGCPPLYTSSVALFPTKLWKFHPIGHCPVLKVSLAQSKPQLYDYTGKHRKRDLALTFIHSFFLFQTENWTYIHYQEKFKNLWSSISFKISLSWVYMWSVELDQKTKCSGNRAKVWTVMKSHHHEQRSGLSVFCLSDASNCFRSFDKRRVDDPPNYTHNNISFTICHSAGNSHIKQAFILWLQNILIQRQISLRKGSF